MGDDQVTNRLTAGGDVSGPVIQSGGSVTINPRGKAELAAVIAIIALATALILVLTSDDDALPGKAVAETTAITTEPPAPPTTETTTTTVEATTTTTTADPTTSETTVTGPPVYARMFAGHWRLRETNVDVSPPRGETSASTSFSVDYVPGIPSGAAMSELYAGLPQTGAGAVATWDESRAPQPEECFDQVSRVGSDRVTMTAGGAYCLVTEQGTVAYIHNVEFLDNGVFANLTTWSPQS